MADSRSLRNNQLKAKLAAAGWMAFAFYALCMVGQLVWVLTEKIQEKLGIE